LDGKTDFARKAYEPNEQQQQQQLQTHAGRRAAFEQAAMMLLKAAAAAQQRAAAAAAGRGSGAVLQKSTGELVPAAAPLVAAREWREWVRCAADILQGRTAEALALYCMVRGGRFVVSWSSSVCASTLLEARMLL
jgi:hypothetical protein